MAYQSVSDITSAIATLFQDDVRSAFNRNAALGSLLPVEDSAGQKVTWDVYLTDNMPSSLYVAEGTGVTTPNSADGLLKAELDVVRMLDSFGVTDLAQAKAATTNNPAGLGNLVKRNLMMASERFFSKLNRELYAGAGTTGSDGIVGLTALACLDSGTYAGLDRGTYTLFKGYKNANGGTPRAISTTLVRDVITNIRIAKGQNPTHIVMHPSQRAKLVASPTYFQPVNAMNDGQVALAGMPYQFDGIPIIEDKDCPTSKVVFINVSEVKMVQLPQEGLPYMTMGNGFRIYIEKIAPDGAGDRYALKAFAQLQVGNPALTGVLVDLS